MSKKVETPVLPQFEVLSTYKILAVDIGYEKETFKGNLEKLRLKAEVEKPGLPIKLNFSDNPEFSGTAGKVSVQERDFYEVWTSEAFDLSFTGKDAYQKMKGEVCTSVGRSPKAVQIKFTVGQKPVIWDL